MFIFQFLNNKIHKYVKQNIILNDKIYIYFRQNIIVNFSIQKLKNKHTFPQKSTNWAKLSSLNLTEREETKTRYFAPKVAYWEAISRLNKNQGHLKQMKPFNLSLFHSKMESC